MSETTAQSRPPAGARTVDWTWAGFLLTAFAAVGLVGLFASFAAPLSLQRAVLRETTLDQVRAAATDPAKLADLRVELGDSAPALFDADGRLRPDPDARIAAERVAMRSRLTAEASAIANRSRWLVCVITVMAAAFGVVVMGASRRR